MIEFELQHVDGPSGGTWDAVIYIAERRIMTLCAFPRRDSARRAAIDWVRLLKKSKVEEYAP